MGSEAVTSTGKYRPEEHRRVPLDPKLARKLLRSKGLSPEGKAKLEMVILTGRWRPEERAVYAAVLDGYSNPEEISTVTGLSISKVNTAVSKLEKRGKLRRLR